MAHSLTGMSGEALTSLPHEQLSSASSSMASWDFLFCEQPILPSTFPLDGTFCWRVSRSRLFIPAQLGLLRRAGATARA